MQQSKNFKKELPQLIDQYRQQGKSDQEIYQELRKKSDQRLTIYNSIVSRVRKENISKTSFAWNMTLVILLMFLAISKLIVTYIVLKEENSPLQMLITIPLIAAIIPLYFSIQIYKFQAGAYRVIGFLAIVGVLKSISSIRMDSGASIIDFAITTCFCIVIVIISNVLVKEFFPKFKLFIKPKDGEYQYLL